MRGSILIHEQKPKQWCWRERLFYLFKDQIVYEATYLYTDGGYNHYKLYPEELGIPIARFIVKNRADFALTTQTGKLTYKKSMIN